MREYFQRAVSVFHRRRLEADLEQELLSHLELATEANLRQGMNAETARREALREFGGLAQTRELYRDQRGWPMIETVLQDIRYGMRMLARSPGFTAVAVLSLALGIGANTAIFTLMDAVLLKMLPVKNPRELVLFEWSAPSNQPTGATFVSGRNWEERGRDLGMSFSYPVYRRMQTPGAAAEGPLAGALAFVNVGNVNVVDNAGPGLAFLQMVSANYFSMLGVRAVAGRTFVDADDRQGAAPVCVISDRYWNSRFGADPDIAGKAIRIDGVPFTIAGVTQPEFFGLQSGLAVDISVPLSLQRTVAPTWDPPASFFTAEDHWWVSIMGRLKPGISTRQAAARLNVLYRQGGSATLDLVPGSQGLDELRRRFSRPLWVLMGMVALVLLIACVNVANLLLARATARRREIGTRLSLGAPRGRLVRQLLTESLLLASLGGAIGLGFAWWGSRLLIAMLSEPDNPIPLNIHPDLRVIAFNAAACLLTGLLFGLAPALRATRVDLTPSLQRTSARLGLGKALVITQAALSVVLLFGAGLFMRTLVKLDRIDAGFDTQKLLLFGINAARAGYQGPALNDFYRRVQLRLTTLPGVVAATSSAHLLLSGSYRNNGLWVQGYTPKPGERMHVLVVPAGPWFLETMKIPLLRGRDFTERDDENAPKIAVVNEAFVKRYLPDRDPMGQRIAWSSAMPPMEIVAVAKDARYYSLRDPPPATVYYPYLQGQEKNWMHYEVRTAGDPHALVPEVRRLLASMDRGVPLFDVKTQTEQIDESLVQERLFARLSGFFGLLALALACVGLYGVLSYAVTRRTSEIGIRMALGAQDADIVTMVLREAVLLVAAGLAVGIPASLAAARFSASLIAGLLYGIKAADLTSVILASAALLAVAAIAAMLPARRAARVDPTMALRYE